MEKGKVHFGCGYHKLDGWVNVDLDKSCKPDVVADLRQDLPFKSQSIHYIHSEDFVDQLDLERGYGFFKECHRILKESGAMRVLTPDLHQFAKRYVQGDRGLLKLWDEQIGIPLKTRSLCEVFNQGMRLGGHTFLYDGETLACVLMECGFEPKRVSFQHSGERELSGLDIRSPQTGVSLYYECYKRKRNEKKYSFSLSSFLNWVRKIYKGDDQETRF
jgi:predicted SAM-dependent methyltransferase